ncbi:CobW family GTP-binding protein [Rhizobium sp. C4]|uniref:CobW family GTP-binding protein n=1 Tax=Rhizobium sp. C4 TaxID=1349800 RepID=UPI001E50FC6F|nr:GTP-binding protein [Rhizobium sp. C4]MCD2174271.1 GTP-binding protein [Rhizobium sp. C4]
METPELSDHNPASAPRTGGRRADNRIPVTLLTGFLGAGKTTLLNEILTHPAMTGTAVIVNEFGTIPVDHDLVHSGRETYLRTSTGCLCCTATSDIRASLYELDQAIAAGDVPPVRRVVIETTGLADPAPIVNSLIAGGAPAMGLRDHVVARRYQLAGVVTAFDALEGLSTLERFIEGWKQLAFADHIVLTKTDLPHLACDFAAELQHLNPAAKLHDRHAPGFDLVSLFGTGAYSPDGKAEDVVGWLAMERLRGPHEHAHDPARHGRIEAVALTHDVPLDRRSLDVFLKVVTSNIDSGLLRMKGLFAVSDAPERPVVAHAVQHRLYPLAQLDRWPDENRQTRVVLIGQDMPIKQIRELFAALAPAPRRAFGWLPGRDA